MQPHHIHDCSACKFLGAVPGDRGPVDLYVCASARGLTYIARFSSEGPDYSSFKDRTLDKLTNIEGHYLKMAEAIHAIQSDVDWSISEEA